MDTSLLIQLLMIVILIMMSAFFSSAETALTTVNRIRIETLAREGNKRAKITRKVINEPARMLSTILIGNNIVNMAVSALTTTVTIRILGDAFVGLCTGILTLLILIFGEITPKTMASMNAEKLSLSFSPVIYPLMTLMRPLIFITGRLSGLILALLHAERSSGETSYTETELRTIMNTSQEEGVIELEEEQMINNVFDFGDSLARDVMIPRINICLIDVNTDYEGLMAVFREHMHTRYPVTEGKSDNVIGIINVKDLILGLEKETFSLRDYLREPYFTYEYKKTADLLLEMRRDHNSLAVVVDEYGSLSGLVTLEDLLEEIVGEIRDEYDETEALDFVELEPGREYRAAGFYRLEDLNDRLGTDLHSKEYDSVGGYMIEQLDSLPYQGQAVTSPEGIRLVAEQLEHRRIRYVHIWLPEKGKQDPAIGEAEEKKA